MSFEPKFRAALLAAAALIALSACGRRGELEPPPNVNAVQTPENKHSVDFHRPDRKIVPPNKDFVLDPLLK